MKNPTFLLCNIRKSVFRNLGLLIPRYMKAMTLILITKQLEFPDEFTEAAKTLLIPKNIERNW